MFRNYFKILERTEFKEIGLKFEGFEGSPFNFSDLMRTSFRGEENFEDNGQRRNILQRQDAVLKS